MPAQKRRTLKRIGKNQYFELSSGERLRHYLSLAHAMENMPSEVFSHHVNEEKNDFALWIRDVFGEEELAKQVSDATTMDSMRIELYKHVIKRHI